MEELYDSGYVLEALRKYITEREAGAFDGFTINFPQGMNTLDPLLLIRLGTLDASFDDQVVLMKASIVGKPVRISLWGEEIGSIQINDVNQGFTGFGVFQEYPMSLQMLIRVCFTAALKNLLPPLSASQQAAMKAAQEARKASSEAKGSKQQAS